MLTGVRAVIILSLTQMERLKYRAAIEFLFLEGVQPTDIYLRLLNVYKELSPSLRTVYTWVDDFRNGRVTIEDKPRRGRPKTASSLETVDKIQDMVLENRRLSERDFAKRLDISMGTVHSILTEALSMRKLCTKWVPHSLTMELKRIRVRVSQENLNIWRQNEDEFLQCFVTADAAWLCYYEQELKERYESGDLPPKHVKPQDLAKKVLISVVWDSNGVLLLDKLETGETMDGKYFSQLLDQLDAAIRRKRPDLHGKKIWLLQDITPAHTSVLAMTKLQDLNYELLDHPPYSPDLAPSNFYLFDGLNQIVSGKHLSTAGEVMDAVNQYFESYQASYFREGIRKLETRYAQCINIRGEYIE